MNDTQWTAPNQAQFTAADEVVDVIFATLRSRNGVHSETAIAAAARLAGTFLFRSFEFSDIDLEPGSVILSNEANNQGPLLIRTLGEELDALRVPLDPSELDKDVPKHNRPLLSVIETQKRLEHDFRDVASKYDLNDIEAAHACALAAARLIHMSVGILDPHIGYSLAVYGFIEGTKTIPYPLHISRPKKRPWYKMWR